MQNLLGLAEMGADIYTGGASKAALKGAKTAKGMSDKGNTMKKGGPPSEDPWNYGIFDGGYWSSDNPNRWYHDKKDSGWWDNLGSDRSSLYTGKE